MSALAEQTSRMLEHLPDDEITIINALIKKLIVAWDPDFTKLTEDEKRQLDEADEQMKHGDFELFDE